MGDPEVLVIGECNPDLVLTGSDVAPVFGQVERLVEGMRLTIGSSGAIFACGAARLGLRTAFAGLVGDDLFGRFMLTELREAGVDVGAAVVDPAVATGLTVVLNRGTDRAILTYLGAVAEMTAGHVDERLLGSARHVHVTSYFMQRTLQPELPALLARAKAAGATVSLDTNWDPAEAWNSGVHSVIPLVDVLLPNEAEVCALAGIDGVGRAARALAARGPVVAVKRGAMGGLLVAGDDVLTAPALAVEPVDTTGAGDSFDAGFLRGYLRGASLDEALRLACACGSLSTRGIGGTAAQPTYDDALAPAEQR
jgi:sugar/nucleoside kinase (ribokinase family)